MRKIGLLCLAAFVAMLLCTGAMAVPTYSVYHLDSSFTGTAINENFQVAGIVDNTGWGDYRAAIWDAGVLKVLNGFYGGITWATDINDSGVMSGYEENTDGTFHAFKYENGNITPYGLSLGSPSYGKAINNYGAMAGYAGELAEPCVWDETGFNFLGSLGGKLGMAESINDNGVVVGWSETATAGDHPFIYENGVMKDLEPNLTFSMGARANDINNLGQVVGDRTVNLSGEYHACLWQNGTAVDLGTAGISSTARAINNSGCVVGDTDPDGMNPGGFVAIDGVSYDLNNQIDPSWGVRIVSAVDITDTGIILAHAIQNGYYFGSVLLTPETPEPPPTPVQLTIDVVPGKYPNQIDLGGKSTVYVAVPTSSAFDPKSIDTTTIKFAGASPISIAWKDYDRDRDADLYLGFAPKSLGLTTASTEATLTATLTDGQSAVGTDSVVVVSSSGGKGGGGGGHHK